MPEKETVNVLTLMKEETAKVGPTIISGNTADIEKMKKRIIRLAKEYGTMRKMFDDSLLAARAFQADFAKGVDPIRKPKTKKNGETITSVFDEDDLFD